MISKTLGLKNSENALKFVKIKDLTYRQLQENTSTSILYIQRMDLNEGARVGLHDHPHWQLELLFDGAMDLFLNKERWSCPPRRLLFLPPGV